MTTATMTDTNILAAAFHKAKQGGWISPSCCVSCGSIHEIIFSHDFAKAFWGKNLVSDDLADGGVWSEKWQYHLQQMVLEENPLEYIARFI